MYTHCAGAVTYQEAEPYLVDLRLHATGFLQALKDAGFGQDGILNGQSMEQYICNVTSETAGEL